MNFKKILSLAFLAVLAVGFLIGDPGQAQAVHSSGINLDLGHLSFGLGFVGLATNKITLRTVEEFMSDYTPVYQPLYPLFLSKSQQYEREVGKREFRRVSAVGDIRGKHITPKDTEIRQIGIMEGKKTFKKYFLANQFTISEFQDQQGIEEVVAQVLDEHQIHQDELFMLGEGTSASDMINNGLFWSADPNYTLESSVEVDNGGGSDWLPDLHARIVTTATKADQVAGRKVLIVYGSTILPLFNGVYKNNSVAFKRVLADVLGANYSLLALPEAITPSSANGWIVANLDQVKTHYTALPELMAQGMNDEKMYFWSNFVQGSMMLEVLAANGIVRQPATKEAAA
jgi:hypothetical protein